MNRINRAAGIAAATVALVTGVTYSAPSQAENSRFTISAPAQPALDTSRGIDAALDTADQQVRIDVPTQAGPQDKGFFNALWAKASTLFGAGTPAAAIALPERARSLDELVVAFAGDQTEGSEQDCLAKAVYFEARGESLEGQLAVAEVVMNRAASGRYPATLCAVITQPWQFSFIHKGRFPTPDFASQSWRKAVAVARIAQQELADEIPANVLWYHATYVSPSWGKRLTRTAQIGLHIFYS